jgi:hypothetical protein
MEQKQKQKIGCVHFSTEFNEYAIKCKIYNKLTKMGLVTYKNTWQYTNNNVYILDLNEFTVELQNNALTLYSSNLLDFQSTKFKCLSYILHELS